MQKIADLSNLFAGINRLIGNVVSFGLTLIMIIGFAEVTLRYVFNRPTVWAWEVNGQLFAAIVLLGGGYTLLYNDHVKLDLLYDRLSPARKALADVATFPLFLLFFGILLWQGIDMAWMSLTKLETSPTFFAPPLYPIKMCVPVGAFLILLQGLTKFIHDVTTIMTKRKEGIKDDS